MQIRTQALILNSSPIQESSLLLVLFTERLGKLRALARGALKSKKRFLGILLHLNQLEVELSPSPSSEVKFLLNQAHPIKSRLSLAQNPARLCSASALGELIEKALPELEPCPKLFQAIEQAIDQVQFQPNFPSYFFYYLLKILAQLGYLPALESCPVCGKKISQRPKTFLFSLAMGGLLCPKCSEQKNSLIELPLALGQTLRAIPQLKPQRIAQLKLTAQQWSLLLKLFSEFTTWHLEKPILSLQFLIEFSSPKEKYKTA